MKKVSMSRRGFFNVGAKTVVGATVLGGMGAASTASANEAGVEVMSEISNNHGHELKMSLVDLVALLRSLQPEERTERVSIQGQSHPHFIDVSYQDALSVLLGEEVVLESTTDFSHSHEVRMTLEV